MAGFKRKLVRSEEMAPKKARAYKAKIAVAKKDNARFTKIGKKWIAGSGGKDLKRVDYTISTQVISSAAPYVTSFVDVIAQGTTGTTRVGQKIKAVGVQWKFDVYAVPGATASAAVSLPAFMDMIIVGDNGSDGSDAAAATIFQAAGDNTTFTFPQNDDRFKILYRKRFATQVGNITPEVWEGYLPLDIDIKYPDSTSPPVNNNIQILFLSPNPTAGTTVINPVIVGHIRCSYFDE